MRYKLVIFWTAIDPASYDKTPNARFNASYFDIEKHTAVITDTKPGDTIENITIEGKELNFRRSYIPKNIYVVSKTSNALSLRRSIGIPAPQRYIIRVVEERDPLFNTDILLAYMATSDLDYTSSSKVEKYRRMLRTFLLN
jgi:hypothetical protein